MSVISKFIARGVFDTEAPGKPNNHTRSNNPFEDDTDENSTNPFYED